MYEIQYSCTHTSCHTYSCVFVYVLCMYTYIMHFLLSRLCWHVCVMWLMWAYHSLWVMVNSFRDITVSFQIDKLTLSSCLSFSLSLSLTVFSLSILAHFCVSVQLCNCRRVSMSEITWCVFFSVWPAVLLWPASQLVECFFFRLMCYIWPWWDCMRYTYIYLHMCTCMNTCFHSVCLRIYM